MSGFGEAERMAERERPRQPAERSFYESVFSRMAARRERAMKGRIVIKGSEIPWQQNRQGKIGYYLHDDITDTALSEWRVFIHEIHSHSGKHVHQGGLGLYVLEGSGSTVINGKAESWKEGDLIVLPILPGGCEHQHFNNDETKASQWLAFIFAPFQFATGAIFEQREESPDWKGQKGAEVTE